MTTKIIWTYWHQGWEQAPSLVKQCNSSWIRFNPDYEIHSLDQDSLLTYLDFSKGIDYRRKDLTIQKMANLIRLALLSKYGGVWTDATVACTHPLSEWLEEYYSSKFFAFRNPGKDRLISNWFLASEPESRILLRLNESLLKYYTENYFSNQGTPLGNKLLKYFNRRWNEDYRTTVKWHSWFARKIMRIYPYYIFHYTFNKLILSDPECAELWNRAKPFPATPSHRLLILENMEDGMERAKREIDMGLAPMYKLNWRVNCSNTYWTTILHYLQEKSIIETSE